MTVKSIVTDSAGVETDPEKLDRHVERPDSNKEQIGAGDNDDDKKAEYSCTASIFGREKDVDNSVVEKQLVRKLDIKIMIILCVWEMCTRLDGGGVLPQARLAGLMTDLSMTEAQYRWCLIAPFLGFLAFSIPINLVLRKWRPSYVMGAMALVWGGVTMACAGVTNFEGLLICQIVQGVPASANDAAQMYYISLWYRRCESAQRFGWMLIAAGLLASVRGLISYGITFIPTTTMNSWQWMFLLYSIPSVLCGIFCLLLLPDQPETATFLNEEERALAIQRLATEQAFTATHAWSWLQVASVLTDWKLYCLGMIFMLGEIAGSGARLNMPAIIDGIGNWDEAVSLALTAPPWVATCIALYFYPKLSDQLQQRAYFIVGSFVLLAVGMLLIMFVPEQVVGARYFAVIIYAISASLDTPIRNAWWLTRRAVASAFLYMAAAAGNTIGGQAYF
ncbi:major facilitator superfamily domain-containing protein [Zychaea mexicana]|uniref:major facilitator superfamily domain-containing protein n=1 Tax=Zychaea mexicana TaxID=64656 RepID=UPI0022FE6F5E|nr:major facilitator superfamily domain-containing protein [Zychaea mexicana]KAI9494330.1 major facilitator superfamily domain-containing protein [Zychaea mexicana]